ncbi:MAG: rhomboid family intramembrane serine protease [Pirellulales bacterium]|nr:rhomboid family intramembrane serine protease [Pirellulales bacterium]
MIPLRDNISPRRFPIVNYVMIGICAIVFLLQVTAGDDRGSEIVESYGMIPQRVFHPDEPVVIEQRALQRTQFGVEEVKVRRQLAESPVPAWLTLLTCIFLHGGWLHFLGNMWFLHIFGDNVEDRLGHLGYFLVYLVWGVAASGAHLLTNGSSPIPTIGASGAVAGVMGAYLLLYSRATVLTLIPLLYFIQVIVLPAPLFLGIWFLLQFFQGAISITATATTGVAWWAHIGGFVAGAAVAFALRGGGLTSPPVEHVRTQTDHVGGHRYATPYRNYRRKNW